MVNRVVVGAHYGLGNWLAQRITAVIMAVFTILFLIVFLRGAPLSYGEWKAFMTQGWMRIATLLFAVSFAWHAWVGVRDIIMDYVKPDGVRLALQVVIAVVIAVYLGWTVEILWR